MTKPILDALMCVLSEDDAQAVIDHRRTTIKRPLTVRGAQLLVKEFAMVEDTTEAVNLMIKRGWQGFEARWYHNANMGQGRMQASTATMIQQAQGRLQ